MNTKQTLFTIVFLFSSCPYVFAGGAVARQNQIQQMQQQQIYAQQMAIKQAQEKAYQEAVQKRMAEYLAAKQVAEQKKAYEEAVYQQMYQKKLAEKLAYEKAMKAAIEKKASEALVQQRLQQNMTYQQQIREKAAREYQLAMATSQQKQQLMDQYKKQEQQELMRQQQSGEVLQSGPEGATGNSGQKKKEEIVDISQVWEQLEHNCDVWDLMIDREPKEYTIQREIDSYAEQGVTIKKSASYYTDRIDAVLSQNPEMKQYPLKNILRILAVMDYDFDNGQNKDLMAMEVLGAKLYNENKKRPGLLDDVY